VPEGPCITLDDAVNALWIGWVAVHMENTNAGFSLGRLDQWLQPYFVADLEKLQTGAERAAYIEHAIELVGSFYMRCTDHLPIIPDIGNYLFGGSSSDQAITLGGVTPQGEDAVNDMTYIFLKVTEMLGIRDPNVNARYNREKNSPTYLKRLCEVNVVTTATPSIHNDTIVMKSLDEFHYAPEDLRDWSATGCVEPTLSGKHIGHTNCMMMQRLESRAHQHEQQHRLQREGGALGQGQPRRDRGASLQLRQGVRRSRRHADAVQRGFLANPARCHAAPRELSAPARAHLGLQSLFRHAQRRHADRAHRARGIRHMKTPLVFEITSNVLDDGPGIRSVIFLKGCPLACVWCQNPEGVRPGTEIAFDARRCIQCDSCLPTCVPEALAHKNPAFLDRNACTLCFARLDVCPSGALSRVGQPLRPEEVVERVLRDKPFYDVSGGGVTLSGGEPTLHLDCLAQVLPDDDGQAGLFHGCEPCVDIRLRRLLARRHGGPSIVDLHVEHDRVVESLEPRRGGAFLAGALCV
jgi:ferredoxin